MLPLIIVQCTFLLLNTFVLFFFNTLCLCFISFIPIFFFFFEGYLPVQLPVSDRDQPNKPNSKITVRLVSQTPDEPKISLHQLHDRLAQLTLSGCFDYDVSRTEL